MRQIAKITILLVLVLVTALALAVLGIALYEVLTEPPTPPWWMNG